jgi:hypothetical protein
MWRSYTRLQRNLHPDTIFFLGDLFDGGREWGTGHRNVEDPAWAHGRRPDKEKVHVQKWSDLGNKFWLHEYDRFGKIFFANWNLGGDEPGPGQRGRRIIATLPGNHDLGFGTNINIPVRNRFETYFGLGNRVDVVGNHTLVSVDSVSLSASGADDSLYKGASEIARPVEEFLANITETKRRAVKRELRIQNGLPEDEHLRYHGVDDILETEYRKDPAKHKQDVEGPEFPTILLTHVPLYRPPGTPCGPLRERHPPTAPMPGQPPLQSDDANAISISGGYQYQNVLSAVDSTRLVQKIGDVQAVFSGDDHDYCELVHPADKNGAREITVKSISWAMGVRRPGFLMVSLWNPVDSSGQPLGTRSSGHGGGPPPKGLTIQTQLCLLPDQIGILIRYGILAGLSVLVLLIRAYLVPVLNLPRFAPLYVLKSKTESLLPTTKPRPDRYRGRSRGEKRSDNAHTSDLSTFSNDAPAHGGSNGRGQKNGGLAPRSAAARTRSVSPAAGYHFPSHTQGGPLIDRAGYYPPPDRDEMDAESEYDDEVPSAKKTARLPGMWRPWRAAESRNEGRWEIVAREAAWSIWRVLWVVGALYIWLVWTG